METRLRSRPLAVPVRREPRARSRGRSRAPGRLDRFLQAVCSARFWWACLAKLAGAAALLGSSALLYHLMASSRYYVSEVTVEGNRLVGTQEVVELAGVSGMHILWVNPRQTAQRLRQLPAVEHAEVRPLFPRRVEIRLVERVPSAQWQAGGAVYLVDREGRVLGPAGRDSALPLVRDTQGAALQLGDRVPPEAVQAAVELSTLLPPAWQPAAGAFDYAPETGISVRTRAGWQVRFGDSEALPWKVVVMEAIAAEIERRGVPARLIDVRVPGRPYYR